MSNEIVVHKIIRNKIYSTNAEDVMLCLRLALNTAFLQTVPRVFAENYKINKSNLIYKKLMENKITMEIRKIDYRRARLITFYKNGERVLESELTFKYMG